MTIAVPSTLLVDSLPSPVREWVTELYRRQADFARSKERGDRVEVRLVMQKDGQVEIKTRTS